MAPSKGAVIITCWPSQMQAIDFLNDPENRNPAVLHVELPSILMLFFRNSHC